MQSRAPRGEGSHREKEDARHIGREAEGPKGVIKSGLPETSFLPNPCQRYPFKSLEISLSNENLGPDEDLVPVGRHVLL